MKKNILRLVTATMAATLILSATGCGKKNTNVSTEADLEQAINDYDKAHEQEREAAKQQLAEEENARKEGSEKSSQIVPAEEILEADLFDNKFQLGDKVYQFPITVKDFLESDDNIKLSKTGNNQHELSEIITNGHSTLHIQYNETHIFFDVVAPTNKEDNCSFAEMELVGANFNLALEYNTPYIFAGGIKSGDTIDDFKSIFNIDPFESHTGNIDYDTNRKISSLNYTQSSDFSVKPYYTIQVSYYEDTKEISSIKYTYWE